MYASSFNFVGHVKKGNLLLVYCSLWRWLKNVSRIFIVYFENDRLKQWNKRTSLIIAYNLKLNIFNDKYTEKRLVKYKKWPAITGHGLFFVELLP